jgi:hypothetical protein
MRPLLVVALAAASSLASPLATPTAQSKGPQFDRAYALKPNEGVFAYSRISPNGRYLAYASEMPDSNRRGAITTTQTFVDLETKQVQYQEPGIDAYWSNDGTRAIYLGQSRPGGVTIRHRRDNRLARDVAPASLGDYFSWAVRDGRDLILTIRGNYYYLDGDKAVLPHASVPSCPDIGRGERPLISKDGRRITTFVRGTVVVRGLDHCRDIVETGLRGAKADFSFDGRYIAFHTPKSNGSGYELAVVDLERRTVRRLTGLAGSSLFPSWTEDGRLSFRYDGDDYRGFMFASNVLSAPEQPLPTTPARVPAAPTWADVFPETPRPDERTALVLIYASWSAHTPDALRDLQSAARVFARDDAGVAVMTALELSSRREDVDRLRRAGGITLPEIPLAPDRLLLTEAPNQIPTTLLFRDGVMVDRRLGAQTAEELRQWVGRAGYGAMGLQGYRGRR